MGRERGHGLHDRGPQQQEQSPDVEVQLGQEVFDELRAKGMIVATSPLYDTLRPLQAQIVAPAPLRAGDDVNTKRLSRLVRPSLERPT
jgi:hypothetical protein